MKKIKLILLLMSCFFVKTFAQELRPNIIVFMVDDMGWQDTSVPFWTEKTPLNERVQTPNMERLAQMGVKFTQAYANSIGSSTRCSMLTGMNQARHRVTNWLGNGKAADKDDAFLNMPDWNYNGIQPVGAVANSCQTTTFVQLLRKNGYHTIHCGKANWGGTDTYGADPLALGFNVNVAGNAQGTPGKYVGGAMPGFEDYADKEVFLTEALTIEAIKALEQARSLKAPFFLNLSHYALHSPYTADNRFVEKYIKTGMNATEAAYCSLIEGIDKSLGDVLDYLDKTKQLDNTIVIFTSDNGALATVGRTKPYYVQNAPLRSGKGSVYEGGVRVPMMIYWKGIASPNTSNDNYLIAEDFYPSILEMANITNTQSLQQIDGKSFIPLLKGAVTGNRAIYWNTPNNWMGGNNRDNGFGQTCAIRKGIYKMIYWYKDGKKELYDLSADISEANDLFKEQPEKVSELSIDLGEFLRSVDAQRPSRILGGKMCEWPDQKQKTFAEHWQFADIAVEEPGYHLWGSSPVWGEDGSVHLFVARWKKEHHFDPGWRSACEIAHYVSKTPEGPFKFSDIVLQGSGTDTWDKYGIHNPNVQKVGDKYVLLYISNDNYNQPPHPKNQKTGMLISNSLYGPWKKVGQDGCILKPSENPSHWTYDANNGVVNPALLVNPNDGKFYLYFKSKGYKMGVAIADKVEGPYVMTDSPVTKNKATIEDGYAFMMDNKFCLLTTDNHGIIRGGGGLLWTSDNGTDFTDCEPGFLLMQEYLPKGALDNAYQIYGPYPKFERPQVLMKKGRPAYLYVPSGANMKGNDCTIVHVLKYVE